MRLSQLVLAPVVAGALVWVACGEPLSHIYAAEHYYPAGDCLFPGKAIDVVAGPPDDAGFCDAICITDLDGDVYVSGQCPPYPTAFDLKGDNPLCAKAFAATCRLCPIYEDASVQFVCDAGAPEDATRDGAEDAKKDSRGD